MNFSVRSNQKELLDGEGIPFEDIRQNMKELEVINHHLGGHRVTLNGFRRFINGEKNLTICEIGCGGGDNLKALYTWSKSNGINLQCTGIDILQNCIDYASEKNSDLKNAHWICSDYRKVILATQPDIIFNSLFCHHFNDRENVELIKWMAAHSRLGFFINDLHRHPMAFYSIRWLTKMFSNSYLVKNDAPLSVMRGFRKNEWEAILEAGLGKNEIGLYHWSIEWVWAFRWLITVKHEPS